MDDDRATLDVMDLLLRRIGYETLLADSVSYGLHLTRTTLPDLVLLDLQMAPLDGWEYLEALTEDPDISAVPVMLFTARPLIDERYAPYVGRLAGVLVKPVSPMELEAVLERFFEGLC
ncbi:response regulator [Methanofollis fontis]|uniref:response regulator n=1 Tax=Methanofollis fontis TaxID=2052832 RepID=UPI001F2B0EC9|nr:response regulator [Methanofollis fontis]